MHGQKTGNGTLPRPQEVITDSGLPNAQPLRQKKVSFSEDVTHFSPRDSLSSIESEASVNSVTSVSAS